VRIWDQIKPEQLCRKHLLGEHRELHGLWNILQRIDEGKKPQALGYGNHPETRRWIGHAGALRERHNLLVIEMQSRGYNHASPLPEIKRLGSNKLPEPLDDQAAHLKQKECLCQIKPD
jgi:hypothetical protein